MSKKNFLRGLVLAGGCMLAVWAADMIYSSIFDENAVLQSVGKPENLWIAVALVLLWGLCVWAKRHISEKTGERTA